LAQLNRHSGEPDIAAHTPGELIAAEAFQKALVLTSGRPYARRCRVKRGESPAAMAGDQSAEVPTGAKPSPEDLGTVCSADYAAIVKAYTNKKGELSYDLLNKALIKAAHANPFVAEMRAT
jgi:hypothetical protein